MPALESKLSLLTMLVVVYWLVEVEDGMLEVFFEVLLLELLLWLMLHNDGSTSQTCLPAEVLEPSEFEVMEVVPLAPGPPRTLLWWEVLLSPIA